MHKENRLNIRANGSWKRVEEESPEIEALVIAFGADRNRRSFCMVARFEEDGWEPIARVRVEDGLDQESCEVYLWHPLILPELPDVGGKCKSCE